MIERVKIKAASKDKISRRYANDGKQNRKQTNVLSAMSINIDSAPRGRDTLCSNRSESGLESNIPITDENSAKNTEKVV